MAGPSHVREGLPCQDHSHVADLPEWELALLVCSDGAGSASRSEVGSEIACRTLADEVTNFAQRGGRVEDVTRETAVEWLEAVRGKLETQAAALGLEVRQLACTVVAALLGREDAVFLQVGDGAVVVAASGSPQVVFWPDQGEYANTTFFVTGPDAVARLKLLHLKDLVTDVALFTDGLQSIALRYQSKEPHWPFFAPMFSRLRSDEDWQELNTPLQAFLQSEAVTSRTDDDCTLVLASRT